MLQNLLKDLILHQSNNKNVKFKWFSCFCWYFTRLSNWKENKNDLLLFTKWHFRQNRNICIFIYFCYTLLKNFLFFTWFFFNAPWKYFHDLFGLVIIWVENIWSKNCAILIVPHILEMHKILFTLFPYTVKNKATVTLESLKVQNREQGE